MYVEKRRCNVFDAGLMEYGECLELQHSLLSLRQDHRICDTLIITEHPPVYTFGRSFEGKPPELPYPSHIVERGGEGTFHCPGQRVAYPIMDIMENGVGVRTLVLTLLSSASDALKAEGIAAEPKLDPVGLWVGGKKIASVGLAIKRWVSFHGIAVNLNNGLDGFAYIQPCGLSSTVMTSASQLLGRKVDTGRFVNNFVSSFMSRFGFDAYLLSEKEKEQMLLSMQKNKNVMH
ncbi:MAG: lipoyl(octanoyl) transferase LipB [Methanomassiliicoccales archaeon]